MFIFLDFLKEILPLSQILNIGSVLLCVYIYGMKRQFFRFVHVQFHVFFVKNLKLTNFYVK